MAAANEITLLVFHECALCGYPPIENKLENIDPSMVEHALKTISFLAKQLRIYVSVGTVRFDGSQRFNSMITFDNLGAEIGYYDKTALWGWDKEHFSRGNEIGILKIDHIVFGFRICYDIRFPESFRELYQNQVDVCFVSFSDTNDQEDQVRYNTIKSHLITRAVENIMTVISTNSISRYQTAPTGVFNHDGMMIAEAERNKEGLLIYEYQKPAVSFSIKGRMQNNDYFMHKGTQGQ